MRIMNRATLPVALFLASYLTRPTSSAACHDQQNRSSTIRRVEIVRNCSDSVLHAIFVRQKFFPNDRRLDSHVVCWGLCE